MAPAARLSVAHESGLNLTLAGVNRDHADFKLTDTYDVTAAMLGTRVKF